jgi:hypothetical protein
MPVAESRVALPFRRSLNSLAPLCCFLFLFALTGCGTSEYERRLNTGASKAQAESKWNNLYGPQDLADTPVSVRLPKMFTDSPLVVGVPVGGKPVDDRRVKPMLFDFPGLKLTYETLVEDPQAGKLPCYCHVGAVAGAAGQLSAAVLADLQNKGPFDQQPTWSDFQAETSDGKTIACKKLRVTGQQDFYTLNKAGQEQYQQLPGLLEVYVHEEAGQQVLIAWRMPVSIEGTVALAKWAPVVAGSVSIKK